MRSLVAVVVALMALSVGCSGESGSSEDLVPNGADGSSIGDAEGEVAMLCVPGQTRCGEGALVERCAEDGMEYVAEVECTDGNPCTDDTCQDGACSYLPASACDDGDPCTRDLCFAFTGEVECTGEPDPAAAGCCASETDCDDGRDFTEDICDVATGSCINNALQMEVEHLHAVGAKGGSPGQFMSPKGLGILADGRIMVADAGNNRVVFLAPTGEQVFELTQAFGMALKAPGCVHEAPDGRIFVCDTGNDRVLLLEPLGNVESVWPPADSGVKMFLNPTDVAVDAAGMVHVADGPGQEFDTGNRIIRLNSKGQVTAQEGKTGEGGGNFDRPSGVGIAANGNLVVSDQGNNRVQVLSPDIEFLAAFGEEGPAPGMLNGPSDVALDDNERIFIADAGNQRIQVFESCMPDCTGRLCGSDGCVGQCGECPSFLECGAAGMCEGWVAEGEEGCTDKTGTGEMGCGGCSAEACVCTGAGALAIENYVYGGENDAFCCETEWDAVCVWEAQVVCGYHCPLPDDIEWLVKDPTFGPVGEWKEIEGGVFTSPIKVALGGAGLVYVLDTVKARVHIFRVFLPLAGL